MKDKIKNYLLIALLITLYQGCAQQEEVTTPKNKHTAKVKTNDFTTENALHDAVRASDLELVKFLIKQKTNVNQKNQYGYTPLHLAVRYHNFEITKYLISQKAEVNTIDVYKDTPLLDSTRNNDTNISEILICNGANRDVKDVNDMSTLHNSSKNHNIYISTLLKTDNLDKYCKNKSISNLAIKINEELLLNDNKPKICGVITKGDINKIDLSLQNQENKIYGNYKAKIEPKNNTWCADVTDELPNGKYKIQAVGYNSKNHMTQDTSKTEIYIIKGLYEALMDEFKDDFNDWKAELDKDTLVFRFSDPTLLFKSGKKDLSQKYKKISDDFFPRYVKVLLAYQYDIENVIIEGHSSSEHGGATTVEGKYNLNMILSQGRADEVLKYAKSSNNTKVVDNMPWINKVFQGKGFSSSNLVLDENGVEDQINSRRVEFRIKTNPNYKKEIK